MRARPAWTRPSTHFTIHLDGSGPGVANAVLECDCCGRSASSIEAIEHTDGCELARGE